MAGKSGTREMDERYVDIHQMNELDAEHHAHY